MKLGIGSYCYMWSIGVEGAVPPRPMTAFDLLAKCRELGVRVVQFGPNLPLDAARIDALSAEARAGGVEVEMGTAGLDAANIREQAALCRRMGATLLRTVDLYEGHARTVRELERSLRLLLPILEDSGVRLALENARTPARIVSAALDEVGSPFLGVTLDTVNSLAVPEGTAAVVDALARHTLCLHVKDFRVRRIWHMMGFTVEGTPAGQGQLDVPWLLARLREAGRDPNAILELWVPQQPSTAETIALEQAWAKESIPYLRRLIPD
ncbi:MAG: sugar phosphate isomerase/epimerase [Acidobacteria bacterium]|nr:sugar phosphate isomerase/epimerase [Acidobacteriota bacterium]